MAAFHNHPVYRAPDTARAAEEPAYAPREEHLSVPRTARFYVRGDVMRADEVWYVLHGYGQRAEAFVEAFEPLCAEGRLIVAPEALSRFYLRGGGGETGASWMTRDDRLHEIEDYLGYLNRLHEHLCERRGEAPATIRLLGFSQGAETACRWVALGGLPAAHLVLWAGRVPRDLDLVEQAATLRRLRLTLVHGTADPLLADTSEDEQRLNQHRIPFEVLTFDGGHELDAAVLADLAGL